ncbi:AP-1 complex subunit mu-1, partial [Tulasnella sp. UAMH 9824]
MASLIAILDLKGKPLIQRSYRDDVPASYVERFLPLMLEMEEEGQQVTPCLTNQGINYMHIRHSNLYLLALSKRNTNAAEVILFLHRLVQVLVEYFKELEEESIRDNFVIIYELLDEMMDFGFPQTTESKILQEYITQESYKLETQVRPPMAVTNAVSWRSEGIRYRKNEVFLDVIESVNLLVNANGNVIRSEILGAVKMKCYLSGMPELRLGLNDKVMFESTGRTSRGKAIEMEDVKFHQCVRLSRFENDRTISFIPPDGEFELMSYRLSTPVKPLIWVEAAVESHRGSRVEYMVKVKAQFKRRSTANNVEIYVPVPDDADSPKFRAATGSVQYVPDKSAFVWKIKQLGGGREFLMRAHFGLPSVKNEEENEKRAPITVKFEIPYFTVSGIQVRYLKIVEKSGYQALPWVRYITQHGDDYSLRTALEKGSAPIVPMQDLVVGGSQVPPTIPLVNERVQGGARRPTTNGQFIFPPSIPVHHSRSHFYPSRSSAGVKGLTIPAPGKGKAYTLIPSTTTTNEKAWQTIELVQEAAICGICQESFRPSSAPLETAQSPGSSSQAVLYGLYLGCPQNHGYCLDCLTNYIRIKLEDKEGHANFPVRCPECPPRTDWEIDDETARKVLAKELLETWHFQRLLASINM